MNTPPQRRSKPRLKAAVACLFAVAVLVGAVGSASAANSTTTVSPAGKVKPPIEMLKVSW